MRARLADAVGFVALVVFGAMVGLVLAGWLL